MKNMNITIGYLYPDLMNIYGDTGNIIALQKRCEWRGIEVKIKNISIGDKLQKGDCDIYFFGGGQDESQIAVARDLAEKKGEVLREEIERGLPLLAICGGYQLLGEFYQPFEGEKLKGVGIFPAFTKASKERMIGNIIVKVQSSKFKVQNEVNESILVGFENHSGKTYLKDGAEALGKVVKGFGNNGEDKAEGCVYKNAIGCYMHGSLLPKNPALADWIIQKALEVKYEQSSSSNGKEIELKKLDDELEEKARKLAISHS